MTTKIGINGFGRIGRQVLKAIKDYHDSELEVVAINDLFPPETNAHLFKYDSNYGIFPGTVEVIDGNLVVDGKSIKVFSERDDHFLCPAFIYVCIGASFPLGWFRVLENTR